MNLKNFNRSFKRIKGKGVEKTFKNPRFVCPATPALTLPVSNTYERSRVRAGLLDRLTYKDTGTSNAIINKQQTWKTPLSAPKGRKFYAGFSIPFPEGWTPLGSLII